jgi:hypothetical protein
MDTYPVVPVVQLLNMLLKIVDGCADYKNNIIKYLFEYLKEKEEVLVSLLESRHPHVNGKSLRRLRSLRYREDYAD